jgi:hypothetical protein
MLPTIRNLYNSGKKKITPVLTANFSNNNKSQPDARIFVAKKKNPEEPKTTLNDSRNVSINSNEDPKNVNNEQSIASEKEKSSHKNQTETLENKKALSHPLICEQVSSEKILAQGALTGSNYSPSKNYQLWPAKFNGDLSQPQNFVSFSTPKVLSSEDFVEEPTLTDKLKKAGTWGVIYDDMTLRRKLAELEALEEAQKKTLPKPQKPVSLSNRAKARLDDDRRRREKIDADEKKRQSIVKENERKTSIKNDHDNVQ